MMFKVHKDATTFDLTGLTPETTYRFEMFTKYGNESFFVNSTNPPKFSFVTAEEGMTFYITITVHKSMKKYLRYALNTLCVCGFLPLFMICRLDSGGVVFLCNELCLGVQRVPGLMVYLVID